MRDRTLLICGGGAALVTLVTVAYVGAAVILDLPTWSWALALALGGLGAVSLLVMYRRVHQDTNRATAAVPRCGELVVSGDLDHVRQQCLVALVGLGARVVQMSEGRLLACTGLRFFRPEMFMGEVIWVTLSPQGDHVHKVEVISIKVDYVSRSRSSKNVARFLDTWATHPSPVA
jgi:hypothetical protein